MVIITFPDSQTKNKAVGFLLGRFSGKVLKSGEMIVPEAALAALAEKDISFTVHGKASYEKQIAIRQTITRVAKSRLCDLLKTVGRKRIHRETDWGEATGEVW